MSALSARVCAKHTPTTSADAAAAAKGLAAFRRLLKTVQRCNARSIASTGDFDVAAVAVHLKSALGCPDAQREGLLLGLADFLASAMDGAVIDPDCWVAPTVSDLGRSGPGGS